ncbi:hypothetical protein GLW36_12805 [Halorubrum terrestre]|uniref:Uncharacterized protein n=1 Tax=Halorubrum distributum TaxID=29283 RepID=A0A6B1IE66_9EURY|nr:hypothetical protein [Halorubrum terrestre]MYL17519.1 hypothetical protein [Halorubrum terrestre]
MAPQLALTSTELDELIELAERHKSPTARIIFEVPPYTGLSMVEFLHLRPDWIYWRDSSIFDDQPVEIHVPPTDTCCNLRWDPRPPEYTQDSKPCQWCLNHGKTNGFEVKGYSTSDKAAGSSLARERVIPVRSDRAEIALRRWFKLLERPGIPYNRNNVASMIQSVVESSSLTDEIAYPTLQRTFVRILAESGVEKKKIAEYTSYDNIGRVRHPTRHILEDSSTDYDFQVHSIDRLRVIAEDGPVTSSDLANEFGNAVGAERSRVNHLQDESFVIQCGVRETDGRGPHEKLYKINPEKDIEGGIPCPEEGCDRIFDTLRGRSNHITRAHEQSHK